MEYWKKLLREKRKRGKSGLTIPFIIGSQKFLSDNGKVVQNIEDLILDIMTNESFETCLRYCLDINALILEIKKPGTPVLYPTFKHASQNGLSVSIINRDIGETIEDLIVRLIGSYQHIIDSGCFSAMERQYSRDSTWVDFTESDIQFIIESLR